MKGKRERTRASAPYDYLDIKICNRFVWFLRCNKNEYMVKIKPKEHFDFIKNYYADIYLSCFLLYSNAYILYSMCVRHFDSFWHFQYVAVCGMFSVYI